MSKFSSTKYLFVYVLLFHFVSSEEKYYIQYGQNKWEITLNDSENAQKLKQKIKENNNSYNIEVSMYMSTYLEFLIFNVFSSTTSSGTFNPGSIVCSQDFLYYIKDVISLDYSQQIGQVIDVDGFNNDINKNIST